MTKIFIIKQLHLRRFGHHKLISFFGVAVFNNNGIIMFAYGSKCVCKGYFAVNKIADFASVICKKRRNSALRQSGNSCGKAYVGCCTERTNKFTPCKTPGARFPSEL